MQLRWLRSFSLHAIACGFKITKKYMVRLLVLIIIARYLAPVYLINETMKGFFVVVVIESLTPST